MAYLLKYVGNWKQSDIPFSETADLNRTTLGDSSKRLSREHATIHTIDDHFEVIDHGSVAGTWVNGVKIGFDISSIPAASRYSHENVQKLKSLNKGSLNARLGSIVELGAELFTGAYRYRITIDDKQETQERATEDIPTEFYDVDKISQMVHDKYAKPVFLKSLGRSADNVIEMFSKLPKPILYLVSAAITYGALDLVVNLDSGKHLHEHAAQYYEQLKNLPSELLDNIFRTR